MLVTVIKQCSVTNIGRVRFDNQNLWKFIQDNEAIVWKISKEIDKNNQTNPHKKLTVTERLRHVSATIRPEAKYQNTSIDVYNPKD